MVFITAGSVWIGKASPDLKVHTKVLSWVDPVRFGFILKVLLDTLNVPVLICSLLYQPGLKMSVRPGSLVLDL